MATTEEIIYAGQVIVDSVTLQASDGSKKVNLYGLFSEIDLFEDLYSPSMTGSIRINESFNLISTFPILGEEILEIGFHTPTFGTTILKKFYVTAIKDKVLVNNKVQGYTMKFVSLEAAVDLTKKVYKAFEGTPTDSAIEVFKTYFPKSKLQVSASSNVLKLVAPTVSPFAMMNILASKAIDKSKAGIPNFLFYEDNQTYNFVSLTELFKQTPKARFRWSASQLRDRDENGLSTRNIMAEYENVKDLNMDVVFDSINKTMSGSFGHKVIEIDPIRKTLTKRTYNYLDNFLDVQHLDKEKTNSDYAFFDNDAVVETSVIHPYAHNNYSQDRDAFILTKRMPVLAQNEFIKLDIITHGRSDLKVGDVIEFQMGAFATTDEKDSINSNIDRLYSGRYIISAIQHRVSQNKYETVMQIFKDSFQNPIEFSAQ